MAPDPADVEALFALAADAVEEALGARIPVRLRVELNPRLRAVHGRLCRDRGGVVEVAPDALARGPTALRTAVHELVHLADAEQDLDEVEVERIACAIARDLEESGAITYGRP